MIQDIQPHRLINAFRQGKTPAMSDGLLLFRKNEILLCEASERLHLPTLDGLREWICDKAADLLHTAAFQYAFAMDQAEYYFCLNDETGPVADLLEEAVSRDEKWKYVPVRELRRDRRCTREMAYVMFTALHLREWYRGNVFCGSCGGRMKPASDERALDCSCCGKRIYPRINPAVIVGVTNGDQLLITRYADRPLAVDALVAGFTEIGETLEETVAREVMEEAGLKVRNIRYYKSQPWGVAADILSGFYCDVDGDPTVHRDPHELKSAVWTQRNEIQGQPDDLSLTNEMMLTFRDGKEPK